GGRPDDLDAARDALDRLTGEYQQLQAQIRASNPRYAALTQPEPLSPSDIQRTILDDDTVLLEFALGDARSWLWAVTADSITSIELPPRRDVERAARSLYEQFTARQPRAGDTPAVYSARVAGSERRLRRQAAAVSDMLFSGIAGPLRGAWRHKR